MGSGAGVVLELRVVLSLAGLSVPELVAKEGSKSTTVAVVSAACLRGQGETKKSVRNSDKEGVLRGGGGACWERKMAILSEKKSGRGAEAHICIQCK